MLLMRRRSGLLSFLLVLATATDVDEDTLEGCHLARTASSQGHIALLQKAASQHTVFQAAPPAGDTPESGIADHLLQAVTNLKDSFHISTKDEDEVKLANQRSRWKIRAKPKYPNFFFDSVPSQAYPSMDNVKCTSPDVLKKILDFAPPYLNRPFCSTCAMVGGEEHRLRQNLPGPEIDAHDCVFRMNHGVASYLAEDRPKVSGVKTTHYMFYCCYEKDQQWRLNHTDAMDWIFVPTRKEGMDWAISALTDGSMGHDLAVTPLLVVDPKFTTQVKSDAGLSYKPLAGTILLSVAMQLCDAPVDVYGVDAFNEVPYRAPGHHPKEDNQWVQHLHEEGRVRIH